MPPPAATQTPTPAEPAAEAPEPEESAAAGETLETLAGLADEHYRRAMEAQRQGNWALYGEEIKKLGEVIAKMRGQPLQEPPRDKP